MAKSIKLQEDIYIDSTGIVHNKKILSEVLVDIDSKLKIINISKEITLSANSFSSGITFGNITVPDGYVFVGIMNGDCLNDRILSTYSSSILYGQTGNMTIYASFYNTWGAEITKTMGCSIMLIKK